MSEVVDTKGENDAPIGDAVAIPEELRLRLLRTVEEALQALTTIDADYLTHPDQRRLDSAIDRQLELETQLAPMSVQLAPGMKLSKREKFVLMHIRRSGRIMHSDLRRALHHYRSR